MTGSHEVRGSSPLFSTIHDRRRETVAFFIRAHGATVSAEDS